MPFGVPTKYKKKPLKPTRTGTPVAALKLKPPAGVRPTALKVTPVRSFRPPFPPPKVLTPQQVRFRRHANEIRATNLARDLKIPVPYFTPEDSPGLRVPNTHKLFEEARQRGREDLVRKHFGIV